MQLDSSSSKLRNILIVKQKAIILVINHVFAMKVKRAFSFVRFWTALCTKKFMKFAVRRSRGVKYSTIFPSKSKFVTLLGRRPSRTRPYDVKIIKRQHVITLAFLRLPRDYRWLSWPEIKGLVLPLFSLHFFPSWHMICLVLFVVLPCFLFICVAIILTVILT